ncbi:MAG: GGDEF domain-containing response regulator [Lautropia sp.]|nr:GGDEF domain-containing response regulator [Lautropia sp.]
MSPEVQFSVGGLLRNRSEDALIRKQNTVLLLDADPVTRQTVFDILAEDRLGELVAVDSEEEAERLLDAGSLPALVLIGLKPGDDSRLQWLRQRRRQKLWQDLPIILLSADSSDDPWAEALALGLTDVLSKPLNRSALLLKLRRCLSLKIYRDRLLKLDQLTGLTNRTGFMRRLEVVLRSAPRKYTLLLLDVDRFRQLNEGLGDQVGDAFLKALSQRLEGIVSRYTGPDRRRPAMGSSPWLARAGDDRFMALLPGGPRDECHQQWLTELTQALSRPLHIDGRELFISTSIGLAIFPTHGKEANQLIQHAETALTIAKRRGGHRIEYFDPTRETAYVNLLALESHLRHAIRYNELQLVYQPKLDSRDLKIVGVEALIRWHHRDLGMILPEHFVPIAERSGLIADIGAWALNQACHQGRQWLDAGLPPLHIAVNVSAVQTLRGNLGRTICQALQDTGFPPELLILELTESLLVENGDQVRELIGSLKQQGLSLSLDDFGTGYSSLTYLHTLPFDEIKIDRSFIRGLPHKAVSKAIVHAILALADGLKLEAVAEGIETTEEFNCLQQFLPTCMIQGNLFCPPLSANQLEAHLHQSLTFPPRTHTVSA